MIEISDRIVGVAVGAAVGDAMGMPLEFRSKRPVDDLIRHMLRGRLPPGSFTDDTEMALALVESLLAHTPLDADDLASRFASWLRFGPPDVGNQTRATLESIASGKPWQQVSAEMERLHPESAGNGSLMRGWPVALVNWRDRAALIHESALQSRVTHPHPDCIAACVFTNLWIAGLVNGGGIKETLQEAEKLANLTPGLQKVIRAAPDLQRERLVNSGWVRHTVETCVWALTTTRSFEEAIIQSVNLGNDADTGAAVVGAVAGAAYGVAAIPARWREPLQGEWPLRSGKYLRFDDFRKLALELEKRGQPAA